MRKFFVQPVFVHRWTPSLHYIQEGSNLRKKLPCTEDVQPYAKITCIEDFVNSIFSKLFKRESPIWKCHFYPNPLPGLPEILSCRKFLKLRTWSSSTATYIETREPETIGSIQPNERSNHIPESNGHNKKWINGENLVGVRYNSIACTDEWIDSQSSRVTTYFQEGGKKYIVSGPKIFHYLKSGPGKKYVITVDTLYMGYVVTRLDSMRLTSTEQLCGNEDGTQRITTRCPPFYACDW